jgi:hypothetical protein
VVLKIFSPNIFAKKLTFLFKLLLIFVKFASQHWFVQKNAIFCRKLAKIEENCDHNIDLSGRNYKTQLYRRSRSLEEIVSIEARKFAPKYIATGVSYLAHALPTNVVTNSQKCVFLLRRRCSEISQSLKTLKS